MFANRISISKYDPVARSDPLLEEGNTTFDDDDEERGVSFAGESVSSYEYDEEFELLVKAYMRDMKYTTLNQASLNIVYSLLNAGIVALPFTTQEAGVLLFIGVFIVVAILSAYTSVMVISMANEQRVRTLEDLADCAFGKKGFLAVSVCQIVFSFSLMVITLDCWADIMSDIFRELDFGGWFLQSRNGQVLFGSLIILPLCLLKKSMSSMKWTSYITVFAAISALLAVVATYVTDNRISDNVFTRSSAKEILEPKYQWWSVIFISVFCYSNNQKVFIIYSSLRRRSADRWKKATQRSTLTITLIYLLFGITGYISKQRKDIHLDNFNFFLDNSDERKEVFDPAR
jgi:amino acid permease